MHVVIELVGDTKLYVALLVALSRRSDVCGDHWTASIRGAQRAVKHDKLSLTEHAWEFENNMSRDTL